MENENVNVLEIAGGQNEIAPIQNKRRIHRVTVRFSAAEYSKLKQKAGIINLARFIRKSIVGKKVRT